MKVSMSRTRTVNSAARSAAGARKVRAMASASNGSAGEVSTPDCSGCSAGAFTTFRVRKETASSRVLVLLVPGHRLPQFHLVAVRIHDPGELAVFMRLGAADDFDPVRAQLRNQLAEIVDAIIDHERRIAGAEPLAVLARDMPRAHSLVIGLVIRPAQRRAAPGLQRHAQMLLIPGGQRLVVVPALEEDAADSGDSRHDWSVQIDVDAEGRR